MEDKVAKIINQNNWTGQVSDELREVCNDYFNNYNTDSSEEESDGETHDAQPTCSSSAQPDDVNNDMTEINLDEIPNIQRGIETKHRRNSSLLEHRWNSTLSEHCIFFSTSEEHETKSSQDVDLDNLVELDVPVNEVEEFQNVEPQLLFEEDEEPDVPLWEPILQEEVNAEFEAEIVAVHVEGCCQKKCNSEFSLDELHKFYYESRELDQYTDGTNSLDLSILGQIRSMCRVKNEVKSGNITVAKERQRLRMAFTVCGVNVCEKLFLLANGIKIKRFKRLMKHYKTYGLERPVHKNYKRTPKKTFSADIREKVVIFIRNYAEATALFMPGRLANHKVIVKLLPSSETKTNVYKKYKEACKEANETFVGSTIFKNTWLAFCRDVVVMKPRTDLCAFCQKNITSLAKLTGSSEEEKQEFFLKCQEHINLVNAERTFYKSVIKMTVDEFKPESIQIDENGTIIPNSYDGGIHYSFDYAQQIHIPHDSQQPGPVFF